MLPSYILRDKKTDRIKNYEDYNDLYYGNHYKLFNIDEFEYKMHEFEYICFDLLKTAINTLADGVWLYPPRIEFEDENLNQEWQKISKDLSFDSVMRKVTINMLYLGSGVLTVGVDENYNTADTDDYAICLNTPDPSNWFADYKETNPSATAKANTLLLIKDEKDFESLKNKKAYLLETYTPGKIVYTAFLEEKREKEDSIMPEYTQINPLEYFEDVLEGVLASNDSTNDEFTIVYNTKCKYSLLQVTNNYTDNCSHYGLSDFTLSVISKINAINKYANLSDKVIVANTIPKIELSEGAGKLLDEAIQSVTQRYFTSNATNTTAEVAPRSLAQNLGDQPRFLNKSSYLRSAIVREVMDNLEVFQGGGRGETKYITNDFDLGQLRQAQDRLITAMMSELAISQVLYNAEISTGAKSGIAYKRLMTNTLNRIKNIQNQLEPMIKRIVFSIMQLSSQINQTPEPTDTPIVQFFDPVLEDERELLDNWVLKTQNNFAPLIDAVKDINNVDEETAQNMIDDMEIALQPTKTTQRQNIAKETVDNTADVEDVQ
jgi:hypothetical protein